MQIKDLNVESEVVKTLEYGNIFLQHEIFSNKQKFNCIKIKNLCI